MQLPIERLGELADGCALLAPQHALQATQLGFGCGLCWLGGGLDGSRDRLGARLPWLRHFGSVRCYRLNAGPAYTLRLPTFSSQQADHSIAKFASSRYFHGSVGI